MSAILVRLFSKSKSYETDDKMYSFIFIYRFLKLYHDFVECTNRKYAIIEKRVELL